MIKKKSVDEIVSSFKKAVNSQDFVYASKILLNDVLKLGTTEHVVTSVSEMLKMIFQEGEISATKQCIKDLRKRM